MNWGAIGAIGEVVGAVAVVASLLYLAVQVRQNSRIATDGAYRNSQSAIGSQVAMMIDAGNTPIILKGLESFESLTSEEKFNFDSLMLGLVSLIESELLSNRAQYLTDETMGNWSHYLQRYLVYPGWQDWWLLNKQSFAAKRRNGSTRKSLNQTHPVIIGE